MKKIVSLIIGLVASLCLMTIPSTHPVLASQSHLTVTILDGKDAQISNKVVKINSDDDGSVTFNGHTDANATVTFAKQGGNNKHYKIQADDNGNFAKVLKLSSKTKKCNFAITAKSDGNDKSQKETFTVVNKAYVKPVAESSSASSFESDSSIEKSNDASSTSPSTTSISSSGDMKTDQANGMIVGNANSHIYHTPDQQGYHMNPANAVYFNSEAEAQAAGFRKSLR